MANMHSKRVFGNLVWYDTTPQRWIDAIGPGVQKWLLDTVYLPVDDTTGDPAGFTTTMVEAGASNSSVALVDGRLVLTTDAAENDGPSIQVKGEAFKADAATRQIYFGIQLQLNDAAQSDFIAGLCITDTGLLAGMTDGIYFRKADGSTAVSFVLEKDSAETSVAVAALADNTDVILEFLFNGTAVDCWVDGVLQTRLAATNLPNDEFLTPSLELLTGEANACAMSVAWWRVIQIDGTY